MASIQAMQIINAGVQGTSPAQIQFNGLTWSCSISSVGLGPQNPLYISQTSTSTPAYLTTSDGMQFTTPTVTSALQVQNGAAMCIANSTQVMIPLIISIANTVVSFPSSVTNIGGGSIGFLYDTTATAANPIILFFSPLPCGAVGPVPTNPKPTFWQEVEIWVKAHKLEAILLGIAAAIFIIAIIAGIGAIIKSA